MVDSPSVLPADRPHELQGVFGDSVLVVAAHPDDEVLGCGGTIRRLTKSDVRVHISFLADGVGARGGPEGPRLDQLHRRREAARRAASVLGAETPVFGDFPDNRLDEVPLLEIIKCIENVIDEVRPTTILTHHAGDLNIDHQRTHQAVLTACRPQPGNLVKRLLFFEVVSSSEWQTPGSGAVPFVPNLFVRIEGEHQSKVAALEAYAEEMREWPHARSVRAVEHRNHWLGASVGVEMAEGFILGRGLI
jgi:LmbE family N-acetylglucosaminyl deacetylase